MFVCHLCLWFGPSHNRKHPPHPRPSFSQLSACCLKWWRGVGVCASPCTFLGNKPPASLLFVFATLFSSPSCPAHPSPHSCVPSPAPRAHRPLPCGGRRRGPRRGHGLTSPPSFAFAEKRVDIMKVGDAQLALARVGGGRKWCARLIVCLCPLAPFHPHQITHFPLHAFSHPPK